MYNELEKKNPLMWGLRRPSKKSVDRNKKGPRKKTYLNETLT